METFASNIVNSSFEHVLHSYGIHIISTYKYEGCNCLFIYYLFIEYSIIISSGDGK
jgi:hypothetical protein